MSLQNLLLFAGMEIMFSLTPGPTVMMISAYGFRGGFRASLRANAGIQVGNAIYIVLSALGLGTLIATSATAFSIVKWLGAGYLVFLGVKTLWQARTAAPENPGVEPARGKPFRHGILTQLGNPKAMLFFGALLPQFLDLNASLPLQYLEMLVIILIGEGLILGGYGWLAAQGRRVIGGSAWPERMSGLLMIAIGALFAATAHRP